MLSARRAAEGRLAPPARLFPPRTRSSGVAPPLNSQPGRSGSPTAPLVEGRRPPRQKAEGPRCPARARRQLSPPPPSPVRGRVRGAAERPARPPPARDLPPRLAGAGSSPDSAGRGLPHFLGPPSPAPKGRRPRRVTFPTRERARPPGAVARRYCSWVLGSDWAKRKRLLVVYSSALAHKKKMCPESLEGVRGVFTHVSVPIKERGRVRLANLIANTLSSVRPRGAPLSMGRRPPLRFPL